MAGSSRFGVRCASPAGGSVPAQSATPSSAASGQRGVPAHFGGRHHMGSRGPAALSEMMPTRPQGLNAAAKQYGGRHHYGAQIRNQMAQDSARETSPQNVASQVVTEMFGADDSDDMEALFAEAEALINEAEEEG